MKVKYFVDTPRRANLSGAANSSLRYESSWPTRTATLYKTLTDSLFHFYTLGGPDHTDMIKS